MHEDAPPKEHGIGHLTIWPHQFICLFFAVMMFASCATTRTGETSFRPGGGGSVDSVQDNEKAQATFSGGDGSTVKQAVIITDARGEKTGVRAEYIWLHEHYPGHVLQGQFLRIIDGKAYDEMRIVSADGHPHIIFFDITSFFGKG
jgi:hypothetical protein